MAAKLEPFGFHDSAETLRSSLIFWVVAAALFDFPVFCLTIVLVAVGT